MALSSYCIRNYWDNNLWKYPQQIDEESTLLKITSALTFRQSPNTFRLPKVLEVLLGLLILLELIAPFVTKDYGIDARYHLLWIDQYLKLNSAGVLIPTWVPTAFYGFGGTAFYFYPPFTFYITSLFHLMTGLSNPMALFQTANLLGTIASFFTARWLLRTLGSSIYCMNLGAALYSFAPLRVAELYSRSALSTHVAYVLLPLIWGGLIAVVLQKGASRSKRVLLLALWFGLIALTNVPITIMNAMVIIIAAIAVWRELSWKAIMEIVLAAVIAGCLAVYHYTSVLSAQPYAELQHLIFPHKPADIELYFHLGPGTYQLLLLYSVEGIIAATYIWHRWKKVSLSEAEDAVIRIGLSIAALILFLDFFPLSAKAWNVFPPLQLIQFPWRFYSQLLLFGVLIVGTARSRAVMRAAKWISGLWIAGAMLPVIFVVFNLHLFPHFDSPVTEATEFLPIFFNPLNATKGMDIKTSLDHSLQPHTSDSPALGNFNPKENVQRNIVEPYHETYSVVLQTPHTVTFHRFYWPYWHLYVNGSEIISCPDSLGRATAILPSGEYAATWQLERTPLEYAGLWISGIAWIGLILMWGIGLGLRRFNKEPPVS
jgi:hypothetical protein